MENSTQPDGSPRDIDTVVIDYRYYNSPHEMKGRDSTMKLCKIQKLDIHADSCYLSSTLRDFVIHLIVLFLEDIATWFESSSCCCCWEVLESNPLLEAFGNVTALRCFFQSKGSFWRGKWNYFREISVGEIP